MPKPLRGIDLGRAPADFMAGIREMARILTDWKRDRPEDPPRFCLPPVGQGITVALSLVYPIVCQNSAARELVTRMQDAGRIIGGNANDPTLFMLTVAMTATGTVPAEVRSVEEFQQCKMKVERSRIVRGVQ
jgi:hypothetical protein